jgi:hypothetical protein
MAEYCDNEEWQTFVNRDGSILDINEQTHSVYSFDMLEHIARTSVYVVDDTDSYYDYLTKDSKFDLSMLVEPIDPDGVSYGRIFAPLIDDNTKYSIVFKKKTVVKWLLNILLDVSTKEDKLNYMNFARFVYYMIVPPDGKLYPDDQYESNINPDGTINMAGLATFSKDELEEVAKTHKCVLKYDNFPDVNSKVLLEKAIIPSGEMTDENDKENFIYSYGRNYGYIFAPLASAPDRYVIIYKNKLAPELTCVTCMLDGLSFIHEYITPESGPVVLFIGCAPEEHKHILINAIYKTPVDEKIQVTHIEHKIRNSYKIFAYVELTTR